MSVRSTPPDPGSGPDPELGECSWLPPASPESQGVSSGTILDFLDAVERDCDPLHSLILVRHGRTIAQGWWAPYAEDRPHVLYSVTKAVTATAIGFAVAGGLLAVEDRLIDLFPESVPDPVSDRLVELRVKHLLTMTVGHTEDHGSAMYEAQQGRDLVAAFLSLPLEHDPGTHFAYNTTASCVLASILRKVTGETPLDYLRPRLFEPLGILDPHWDAWPDGTQVGGFGLSLTTRQFARLGQFWLRRGRWEDRQLLPASWMDQATGYQVPTVNPPGPGDPVRGPAELAELAVNDWTQGYGYQFRRCTNGGYRADGAFGQLSLVFPERDTVLTFTAGLRDTAALLNLVRRHLLPGLGRAALPADPAGNARLSERLASLGLTPATGKLYSPAIGRAVSERVYRVTGDGPAPSPRAVIPGFSRRWPRRISFRFPVTCSDVALVRFETARGTAQITCGLNRWSRSQDVPPELLSSEWAAAFPPGGQTLSASGAWVGARTFLLRICYRETQLITNYTFHFEDSPEGGGASGASDLLTVDVEDNVTLGQSTRTRITAVA